MYRLYVLPWMDIPEVRPDLVFYVFVPPLLYYAALFVAPDDLRNNAWLIGLLAVGVVVVSAARSFHLDARASPTAVSGVGRSIIGIRTRNTVRPSPDSALTEP
jgi:hypothetical protein